MEINNVIKNVLMRYPLFGNVIANLEFKYTNDLFPAPAYTDGKRVYYRQELFDNFSESEREFIIAHEIFHIVLQHSFRNVGKDKDLLNFVEDGIINQLLVRDGLDMPEGCVNIPDALSYSVEELYMKYLSQLEQIKEWMGANTYHVEITDLADWIKQSYNKDLQDLRSENASLRSEMLEDYKESLKNQAMFGITSLGITLPSVPVGKARPLLNWKELLKASLISNNESTPSFYEIEPDGIIKKEYKPDPSFCESEIVVDSSGSMDMSLIKVILRECKHILKTGKIRVGFCDTEFYGWHDIYRESDIDELNIIGRGGTDFETMANSFSKHVDNKIVITDGGGIFPKDCPDVLWVVINPFPDETWSNELLKGVNIVYIDENTITNPQRLILNK